MCDDAKKKLARVKMPKTTRTVSDIVMQEISKLGQKVSSLSDKIDNQAERLTAVERVESEILSMVNKINDKLTVDKVEEKAAQMSLVQKLFSTKQGWVILCFMLAAVMALGIAVVYFVEHASSVASIISAAR